MKRLNETEIEEKLKELDGWNYEDEAIHTSLEFRDFKEAFSFMTLVAFEAEAQQHHPEWLNVFNELNISLSTHDAGGVTEKDIKMAKTINNIVDDSH